MKAIPLAVLLLSVFAARGALAHGSAIPSATVSASCCESPARWAARHDPSDSRLAIDSEDGNTTLLITDRVVAIQLSDRTLRKVKRELRNQEDDEDNAVSRAFMAVVLSGVRALLDHSAECPIRELGAVEYRHGRLEFTTVAGERVFPGLDIDGRDALEGFSAREAQAFVREFQRAKARLR